MLCKLYEVELECVLYFFTTMNVLRTFKTSYYVNTDTS